MSLLLRMEYLIITSAAETEGTAGGRRNTDYTCHIPYPEITEREFPYPIPAPVVQRFALLTRVLHMIVQVANLRHDVMFTQDGILTYHSCS